MGMSNGNSFSSSSAGSTCSTGTYGEGRCTEPWLWRLMSQIPPGAIG